MNARPFSRFLCLAVLAMLSWSTSASGVTVRIVSYNIAADIDGFTTARPGLDTVLEAIGEQNVNGVVQLPDVIGLEETTSNAATVAPLAATLNAFYGATVYAPSPYQATEVNNNPGNGNGPNAVLYNTQTLVLVESVGVGTPRGSTGNGESRQVARYQFQPVGGGAANAFYLYVSHMKSSFSGDETANMAARAAEAQIIRTDSATLPADACIIYSGDFNLGGSAEAAYQTLTAMGAGQGIDPVNNNPQDNTEEWDSAAYVAIDTESATTLQYRDDIQFMSANVFDGTVSGGLHYLAGSYRVFGNNGTTGFRKSVNLTTNTALNNLQGPITATAALAALTTASDHLPVVSDYSIALAGESPTPTPTPTVTPMPTVTPTPTATPTVSPTPTPTVSPTPTVGPSPTPTPDPSKPPVILGATSVTTQVGALFAYQILATNAPTGYTVSGLPDGLQLNAVSGFITGTPTVEGTFTATLGATNTAGSATAPLQLTVAPALPSVSVRVLVPTARASDGTAGVFLLTRTGDLSAPLVVGFVLKGAAKSGTDYQSIPLTKKIKAGKAVRRINIVPKDLPNAAGSDRVVKLVVRAATTYTAGAPVKAKVHVVRED